MVEKEIQIDGSSIVYRVYGTGKPVIFVHGFGEAGDVWDQQVKFLENDFRLIVPDLPGSGASGMIKDMSMEGLAASLKSILDTLSITQCIMIGHSMGGYIALAFAEKYPGII